MEDGLLADRRRDTLALAGHIGGLLDGKRTTSPGARA
jgi:hypothetical protein